MRSELVTRAVVAVRNRFLLVHVSSAITRKFHRPTLDRVPESISRALAGLEGKYTVLYRWKIDPCLVPEDFRVIGYEVDLTPPWSSDTGQQADALIAFTTLTTGVPYFPPQSVPAEPTQEMETA